MPLNTQLSTTVINAQANAFSALCNSGTLKVYTGAQPVDSNTAISTQTLLATLTFAATASPSAIGGVITFNPLVAGTAVATGTAGFFRVFESDGLTVLFDGSVGTATSNMIIGTTSVVAGASITSNGFKHTVYPSSPGF